MDLVAVNREKVISTARQSVRTAMTAECEECGEAFETERTLDMHQQIEHQDKELDEIKPQGVGEAVVEFWREPHVTLLIGVVLGIIAAGSVLLTTGGSGPEVTASGVGEKVVSNYQDVAPPGVEYELVDTERQDSGMYAVTVRVQGGAETSETVVYVSPDGRWAFTDTPRRLKTDLASAADQ